MLIIDVFNLYNVPRLIFKETNLNINKKWFTQINLVEIVKVKFLEFLRKFIFSDYIMIILAIKVWFLIHFLV